MSLFVFGTSGSIGVPPFQITMSVRSLGLDSEDHAAAKFRRFVGCRVRKVAKGLVTAFPTVIEAAQ
jgi:hypothetical protein